MYRSSTLAELVKDPHVGFVVPDAALMEICKSDRWEATLRGSLKLLSCVPQRVFFAQGNRECLTAEIELGRPLTFDDLIFSEATVWLRGLLVEVEAGRHGIAFDSMAAEIDGAKERARKEHFNHQENFDALQELIPTLRASYSEDFQRRLRGARVDEHEYVAVVSYAATKVVDDSSMSLPAGSLYPLIAARSYLARWIWLRVETVTDWLASGGAETVAAERVTNSDIDRHYLAIASYCDKLLTNDRRMWNIDRKLRAALDLKLPWDAEHEESQEERWPNGSE